MKIAMLLANPFRPDPRVFKEAKSLDKSGYQVSIICWDRKKEFPPQEKIQGINIIRVQSVISTYGAGTKQLLKLPRFWKTALNCLEDLQPDVLHCHDLDTLPIGVIYKLYNKKKLVFDAHEDYPALMRLYLPSILIKLLTLLELYLLMKVDKVIAASSELERKYRNNRGNNIRSIGNYPELDQFDEINQSDITYLKQEIGLHTDKSVVCYIGGFSRNRQIEALLTTSKNMPDTYFLLAGDGHQREMIEKHCHEYNNCYYLGWLDQNLVPIYTKLADIIYYCLKTDYLGKKFSAPNTLFNAMAAGKPIIVNNIGDLGRITSETNCGIVIEDVSPDSIQECINYLKSKNNRDVLGNAGRIAAKNYYNWSIAEKKLLDLYQEISED